MKLHILSDLHTEFADFVPPETDAGAVILAGDIGVGVEGVRWAARHYPARPVIYVPGNHEFYGHDIDLTAELEAAAPENITVLSDDVLVLEPTLWIHGHTHDPCDYELFRTRVVCNPRGYPGEYGHAGSKPDLTVEVFFQPAAHIRFPTRKSRASWWRTAHGGQAPASSPH